MFASRRASLREDAGVAMITVVMVAAIMTGLGLAVTKAAVVNLNNAGRDRVASGALGAAEAGVAGAITYIRNNGVRQFCPTCTTTWNESAPVTLAYPGGGQAVIWVRRVQEYNPAAGVKTGQYLIRSVGTIGVGPGKRTIEQAIDVKPFDFPLGVYTQSKINLGGNVKVTQESVFSGSCVDSREKLSFLAGPNGSIIDPYNGLPAAVHSTSYIREKSQSVCSTASLANVKATDNDAIHKVSTCNELYKADQDGSPLGGAFTSGTCAAYTAGRGDYASKGSEFDEDTLRNVYGFKPRGLTDEQFKLLKNKAKASGTWFPAGVTPVFPTASTVPGNPGYNPVVYIEDQNVTINNDLNSYAWVSDPSCSLLHPSVILIVERGGLNMGSSSSYTGNLFIPDGTTSFAGGSSLLGTIFTKELKFTGNGEVGMNDCFAKNTNGGILNITKTKFREIDS